jgi:hypothetical protein
MTAQAHASTNHAPDRGEREVVAAMENVWLAFDEPVLKDVSFEVFRGET